MIAHIRQHQLALRTAIFALPMISFVLSGYLHPRWNGMMLRFASPEHVYLALFTTMVWSIVAEKRGVTSIRKVSAENTGIRACFAACGITYIVDLIALFVVPHAGFSRRTFLLSALILLVLSVAVRTLFRILLRELAGHQAAVEVLIVGAGQFAARTVKHLQRNEFVRCHVAGYVQCVGEEVCVSGAPVFKMGDLEAIEKLGADTILIAVPPDRYGELLRCIAKLQVLSKPIRVIVNTGGGLRVRERVVQLGRLQMLDFDPSPTASIGYFLVKRGFDVFFSAGALAVFSIPMLMILLLVKLTSRGPVLFRQQRVGRNGRLFTMYKFRTMRISSMSDGDTRWTVENDPRTTRIGAFLRKTSLDELPQFFNVLKGDMSVVGPRPERPHYVRKFGKDIALYPTRHHLNVGITGWAQVNNLRGNTSIRRRVRYDLYYLQHWSLLFDFRIILMTIWGGFMGKNAY